MEELCWRYRHALDQENIPPLIAIAALILDVLCIHPFRDGNGRVSRLLILLALYQHGYEVGRYISLERLIEESRESYYECLQLSSRRWHDGKHELTPWFNFIFVIIRRAYIELEERAGQIKAPRGAKSERVLAAVRALPGEFRLRDLERECPGVGREWIRTLLAELKKSGDVACRGRGPGARWRFLRNKGSSKGIVHCTQLTADSTLNDCYRKLQKISSLRGLFADRHRSRSRCDDWCRYGQAKLARHVEGAFRANRQQNNDVVRGAKGSAFDRPALPGYEMSGVIYLCLGRQEFLFHRLLKKRAASSIAI